MDKRKILKSLGVGVLIWSLFPLGTAAYLFTRDYDVLRDGKGPKQEENTTCYNWKFGGFHCTPENRNRQDMLFIKGGLMLTLLAPYAFADSIVHDGFIFSIGGTILAAGIILLTTPYLAIPLYGFLYYKGSQLLEQRKKKTSS